MDPFTFLGIQIDPSLLFRSPEAFGLRVIAPPIIYGAHGLIATWCAVKMLFRPYNPKYIPFTGKTKTWWFTPGIFPKRQSRLAQAVATTITDTLLTPEDIRKRAEELVTEENIYKSVDMFVDNVLLKEFRDTTKLHRLAADIASLSPSILEHFVESTIESLEQGKDTKIAEISGKLFDELLLNTRITLDQATEISSRIMENFLTPEKIREILINLLSPQNINALDESINVHAAGPYRILARIIGIKRVCYEWRSYLENEEEESYKLIGDLLNRFGIKHQLAIQIANLDLKSMPLENIDNLKRNIVKFIESFMVEHKKELLDACKKLEGEAITTVRNAVLKFNPESIPPSILENMKKNISGFLHSYLKRELGHMVEEAIPRMGVHAHIVQKIDLFTPQQLEFLVNRICKNELKALEYFGAVIGAIMGILQIFLNAIVVH